MAALTKDELKALFETGDKPDGAAFVALIDSYLDANFDNFPDVLPASSGQNLTNIEAQLTVDEWDDVEPAVGYVDDDELVFSGDLEDTFNVGQRVRLTLGSGEAFDEVLSRSFSSGSNSTTLMLAAGNADNTISDIDVSIFKPVANGGAVGLGTLGGTAFASTLLDDADAAEARQTLGENASGSHFTRKHNFTATAPPTVNDDTTQGYSVGSEWYDLNVNRQWVCWDASTGAAVWRAVGMRAGTIFPYAGAGNPTGGILCNGQNVSRTAYPDLFAAIGTTWGIGDGSTTFGVPNLSRRTLVGKGGTGTGTLGNAVGDVGGAETMAHDHPMPHTHLVSGNTNANTNIVDFPNTPAPGYGQSDFDHLHAISFQSQGVSTPNTGAASNTNNLQPSAVVGWYIQI